ncbi:hypothetical protein [Nonomuraea sp. NPDC049750]|uniref:hypothetical protein n=1 Tax=Nonomuraea sp. NPDC049750 TaxID=3154738 RepID=UPI0033C6A57C
MRIWHRCFMRPIDVQHETLNLFAGTRGTRVLRRCDGCGRHDVETLLGEWPIRLFIAAATQPEVEAS